MTFDETAKAHAAGWKTGFCRCDWCKASRVREKTYSIEELAQSPIDLDQEEARANQEDWWNEKSGAS